MQKKILLATIDTGSQTYLYPQLALYYLKAYFIKNNTISPAPKIVIREFRGNYQKNTIGPSISLEKKELTNVIQWIKKLNPDIIGFSCFEWNLLHTLEIVSVLKSLMPKLIIILGGASASDNSSSLIRKHKEIDYIVMDEGEKTFFELVQYLIYKKHSKSHIRGIVYRTNNQIIRNSSREPLDLREVPSPYLLDLINIDMYQVIPIETSRGCPYRCAYCSFRARVYGRVRFFPEEQVIRELQYIGKQKKMPREINILDDNFNIDEKRAINIFKSIRGRLKKIKIEFYVNVYSLRLSDLFARTIQRLNAGVNVGVQSTNGVVLKAINRYPRVGILEQNLKLMDRYYIKYLLTFIIGLPHQTYQDLKNDLKWMLKFHVDVFAFNHLRLHKGTELYKQRKKYGFKYYQVPNNIVYETPSLKQEEMYKFRKLISINRKLTRIKILKKLISFSTHISNLAIEAIDYYIRIKHILQTKKLHYLKIN